MSHELNFLLKLNSCYAQNESTKNIFRTYVYVAHQPVGLDESDKAAKLTDFNRFFELTKMQYKHWSNLTTRQKDMNVTLRPSKCQSAISWFGNNRKLVCSIHDDARNVKGKLSPWNAKESTSEK